VGTNVLNVVVTAQDGVTSKSYVVKVVRAPSPNADLAGISTSAGALSPAFAPATLNYAVVVAYAVTQATVTPATADSTATIKVNGVSVASGVESAFITLNVGLNPIAIVVTSQAGTVQQYTLKVTRAPNANSSLAGIVISAGTLASVFSSSTLAYSASVPNDLNAISVTPTATDQNAILKVNAVPLTSGTPSGPISLNVGVNRVIISVTAQDGSTATTYDIDVTRIGSSNANLAPLLSSVGSFSPVFDSNTLNYAASVPNSVNSTTVTPFVADSTATVSVNGVPDASGSTSVAVPLVSGTNRISILVTAQDGTTTKSYTLTVVRALSSNANLAGLACSVGALAPAFSAGTLNYTVNGANGSTTATVTPIAADPGAIISVNGRLIASGSASGPFDLSVGTNVVSVVVTSEDGSSTRMYKINLVRAGSSNANLSGLAISAGSLTPAFATGISGYSLTLSNSVSSVSVTPITSDPNATVTINGVTAVAGLPSTPISLAVGVNLITVVVVAQDLTTVKGYSISVSRAQSSNADLAGITASAGVLKPVFSAGISAYTVGVGTNVNAITLKAAVADSTATVKINGSTIASGASTAPVSVRVGGNPISIVVTAQDGTTKSYLLNINVLAPPMLSMGTKTPTSILINGFQISVSLPQGMDFRVQASDDLKSWNDATNFTGSGVAQPYLDVSATNRPLRFYRIISP
jgi:hypothetical protein